MLASGHDFFAARASPRRQAARVAELGPPQMPWDGTELWVGGARTADARGRVAGGPAESICQPRWSPDGGCTSSPTAPVGGTSTASDGSERADARWRPSSAGRTGCSAMSCYAFLADGSIVSRLPPTAATILAVSTRRRDAGDVPLELTRIVDLPGRRGARVRRRLTDRAPRGRALDVDSGELEVLEREPRRGAVDAGYVSVPRPIEFPTEGGRPRMRSTTRRTTPTSPAPAGERPPLDRRVHGGPTAHVDVDASTRVQYWTSRGFAVVDVNYGGSTGYGRAYRERLRRPVGHRRRRRLRQRRALSRRGGRGRRRADGDPRRQRGRVHDAVRARVPRRLRGRRRLLRRRRRSRRFADGHAQVRVALPRRADRPAARRRGDCTRALADPPRRRIACP